MSAACLTCWRFVAWALHLTDGPHFKPHWFYRLTLAVLKRRYRAAERVGGRDVARHFDYIPF